MTPEGPLSAVILALLEGAGLPAAVVAVVATIIALFQFAQEQRRAVDLAEIAVAQAFSASPRRVGALATMLISQVVFIVTTLGAITIIVSDPALQELFDAHRDGILRGFQFGIVAYFVAVNWWRLRHGDEVPDALTFFVGGATFLAFAAYAVFKGLELENALVGVGIVGLALAWFKLFDWAASSGSGVARAFQN